MNNHENLILGTVRKYVNEIDPFAEIFLYGSRARSEAEADSDWDILIITKKHLTWDEELQLRAVIYKFEVSTDTVLSLVIHSKDEWTNPVFKLTPFYQNVSREGIRI